MMDDNDNIQSHKLEKYYVYGIMCVWMYVCIGGIILLSVISHRFTGVLKNMARTVARAFVVASRTNPRVCCLVT